MLYGVGTVFIFLTLLVVATTLMSALVQRFAPALAPQAEESHQADSHSAHDQPSEQILKVIKLAIAQHRKGT